LCRLFCALAALLVLSAPAALAASSSPPPSTALEAVAVVKAFPGFNLAAENKDLPNGTLTLAQLHKLGFGDFDEIPAAQQPSEVYARSWTDGHGHVAMIMLWRFRTDVLADFLLAGEAQGMKGKNWTAFPVPSIPGAVGGTLAVKQRVQSHQVAYRYGTIVAQVVVASADDHFGPSTAIDLAARQRARLPKPVAAPRSSVPNDPGASIAYQIGTLIPIGVVIFGIVVLGTRGASKRRTVIAPPPEPGTPIAPPPIPGAAITRTLPAPIVDPALVPSLARRARLTTILLGVAGAIAIAVAATNAAIVDGLTRLAERRTVDIARLQTIDHLHSALAVAGLCAGALTGIAWLFWQHRAHRTLRAIDPDQKYSPAAIGWWFAPLANLVIPFLAIQELYRGSVPRSNDPRRSRRTALPIVWWLASLSAYFLLILSDGTRGSLEELARHGRLTLASALLVVLAAATAVRLVSLITKGLGAMVASIRIPVAPETLIVEMPAEPEPEPAAVEPPVVDEPIEASPAADELVTVAPRAKPRTPKPRDPTSRASRPSRAAGASSRAKSRSSATPARPRRSAGSRNTGEPV
jgi:uncharacterized protein DUF4328